MLQKALITIYSALQERKTAKIRWKDFVCFLYITQLQAGWKEYCNEALLISNRENALHNLKNKWYTSVSWVATVKVLASQVKPSVMWRAPEMFTRAGTRVKSESREMLCDLAGHWPQSSFAWFLGVTNCQQSRVASPIKYCFSGFQVSFFKENVNFSCLITVSLRECFANEGLPQSPCELSGWACLFSVALFVLFALGRFPVYLASCKKLLSGSNPERSGVVESTR